MHMKMPLPHWCALALQVTVELRRGLTGFFYGVCFRPVVGWGRTRMCVFV